MMLRNFEPEIGLHPARPAVRPVTEVVVEQTVTVTPRPSQGRGFVSRAETDWDWSDLRDYVVAQIEQRFGSFPRDARKEASIFKSFLARHGEQAVAVVKFAFEVEGGYWAGAPISVNRFCKGSDPYFSDRIKPRLVTEKVHGW